MCIVINDLGNYERKLIIMNCATLEETGRIVEQDFFKKVDDMILKKDIKFMKFTILFF